MTAKWKSTCTCCGGGGGGTGICDAAIPPSSGGDAGFCQDYTVAASDVGNLLRFNFNPAGQPDRLVVIKNPTTPCIPGDHAANIATGTVVIDTGCVSQTPWSYTGVTSPTNPYDYVIEPGVTSIRIVVVPNCVGGSGTAWQVNVICVACPVVNEGVAFANATSDIASDSVTPEDNPLGVFTGAEDAIWVFELDIPSGSFTAVSVTIRLRSGSETGTVLGEVTCDLSLGTPRLAVWEHSFGGTFPVWAGWGWNVQLAPGGEGDISIKGRCGTQADVTAADCLLT